MSEKWTTADIPDQSGRTALVTGANSGLGLQTAKALAAAGRDRPARLPQPRQGAERQGRDRGRRAGRRGRDRRARPRRPRLGRARRRRGRGSERRSRPADQQRRRDGPAPARDGRRLRAPVRDQPPRPLRAHGPAPRQAARRARPARRQRLEHRSPSGEDGLRRPQLGAGATRAGPPTGARSSSNLLFTSELRPACGRGGPRPDRGRLPPRVRVHEPADLRARDGTRRRDRQAAGEGRQPVPRPERREGRPAVALRGDGARRHRQRVLRPRRDRGAARPSPAGRPQRPSRATRTTRGGSGTSPRS